MNRILRFKLKILILIMEYCETYYMLEVIGGKMRKRLLMIINVFYTWDTFGFKLTNIVHKMIFWFQEAALEKYNSESKCGLQYSELYVIILLQYSSVESKDHILDYIPDCETNSTSLSKLSWLKLQANKECLLQLSK